MFPVHNHLIVLLQHKLGSLFNLNIGEGPVEAPFQFSGQESDPS